MAKLISSIYGDGLFQMAVENQSVDALRGEVEELWRIWLRNPELPEFLENPRIWEEEKLQVLDTVFRGRLSEELIGFLAILVEKGRQDQVLSICEYFLEAVNAYKQAGTAHVLSAVALKSGQKAKIEQKLLETSGLETLTMDYKVDTSLLGGLVIRIGDRVVNSSIKMQLNELVRSLTKMKLG